MIERRKGNTMIGEQLHAIAKKLLIDFETTAEINHNLEKGETREADVIKEFLKKCLPPRFGVTSGIVFDALGGQSCQMDVIIFDRDNTMPLFTNNTSDVESQNRIPIENVYAVIEVKSKLTNEAIDDAMEKYRSVTVLTKNAMSLNPAFYTTSACYAPAGFVFAYTSDAVLESLMEHIQKRRIGCNALLHTSAFLILDKGIIHYAEKKNVLSLNPFPNALDVTEVMTETKQKGDALLNFTLLLSHVLNSIVLHIPNLSKYLERYSEHFDRSIQIPYNLQSEDMSIVLNDGTRFDNLRALSSFAMDFFKQRKKIADQSNAEQRNGDKS